MKIKEKKARVVATLERWRGVTEVWVDRMEVSGCGK
jgi:hypothetical protein